MTIAYSGDSITYPDLTVQATAPKVGMVNRIINGAMVIDQRNAGASVTPTASGQYLVDRFVFGNSQASKITWQQNAGAVTLPTGFTNYLGATTASAYSVGASDFFMVSQPIEGFNVADFGWGTANAATITLSFLVRSSLTGTFGGALENASNNRCYPFSYTISAANTWEQKTLTIAGDTSGTWLTTNGLGIAIRWGVGVGSTYSGTAGSWGSTRYFSATGATSVVGTSGATFYITGVQLEKGSTATSFDYRPYGTELGLCQRYYVQWGGSSAYSSYGGNLGQCNSTTNATIRLSVPVPMRTSPTISYIGTPRLDDGQAGYSVTAITGLIEDVTSTGASLSVTSSGLATYRPVKLDANNNTAGRLIFSSEL